MNTRPLSTALSSYSSSVLFLFLLRGSSIAHLRNLFFCTTGEFLGGLEWRLEVKRKTICNSPDVGYPALDIPFLGGPERFPLAPYETQVHGRGLSNVTRILRNQVGRLLLFTRSQSLSQSENPSFMVSSRLPRNDCESNSP